MIGNNTCALPTDISSASLFTGGMLEFAFGLKEVYT